MLARCMHATTTAKCGNTQYRISRGQPRVSCRHAPLQHTNAHSRPRATHIRAAQNDAVAQYDEPTTAKEAIDVGLQLCSSQRWQDALGVFEKALDLPGTGLKRYRDKPPLISDGEKIAVLYNIACCHSNLGNTRSGLVAIGGALELGYGDFRQLRTDPDLQALRADEKFEGLLQRFEPKKSLFNFRF